MGKHTRVLSGVLTLQPLTVQLLHKLSIRGINGPEKLLQVIKASGSVS